jgi:hypothetical protein
MNQVKLILAAALVGVSSAAMAAVDTDRDQRMNDALEDYRSSGSAAQNPSPGPFARAEESTKKGVRKAGTAIKHGAQKVGHAVGTGVKKTGDAIGRTGDKIQGSTTPAQ